MLQKQIKDQKCQFDEQKKGSFEAEFLQKLRAEFESENARIGEGDSVGTVPGRPSEASEPLLEKQRSEDQATH